LRGLRRLSLLWQSTLLLRHHLLTSLLIAHVNATNRHAVAHRYTTSR
jgi:hypothetical protein